MEELDENIIVISLKDYNVATGKSIKKYRDKKRFIVVDKQTYDIIDDAQGYGFTSAHGAYKCMYYKQNHKQINSEKQKVRNLWDEHQEFRSHWEDILWYATEDNTNVTEDDFKQALNEYNININSLPCKSNFKIY